MAFTLINQFNVTDDATLKLDRAFSVTTAVVGGTTYLFAAGLTDDGVSVFSVASNGALTNVDNVTDAGVLELDGAISVTTAAVGGTTYLFVASLDDDGVNVFSVAANGALTSVFNVTDDVTLKLDGVRSVTTAVVGGVTYLFTAGQADSGVSVFSVAANGALTNVANVTDAGLLQLAGAISVTTAVVTGTDYLFVAGNADDGISVFQVAPGGVLHSVFNVTDDATRKLDGAFSLTTAVVEEKDDATRKLDGAFSLTTAGVGGTTYLYAAGTNDDGISVFSVAGNGALTNVANVSDDIMLKLDGVRNVTTAVIGGTTYLFAAGDLDSGVSVFSVAANGALTNVANVSDNATLELDGTISVTTAVVGGTTYLFTAAQNDDGISVFVADDGVNDAPVNAGVVAFTVNEDTGYSITGLSISDTDANNATDLTTTLSVASGTLTVLSAGGAAVAGSGTASVTLTGSVTQINTTLAAANNVVYQGSLNFNGSDTLTVLTSDNGNTGTPGALTDTDMATITVTAVNDAPVAADDTLSSVAEDSGVRTITFAALTGNDGDGDPEVVQTLTITAVSNPVGGTVAIVSGQVEFTPTADFNGTASFDYTVEDNGQTNGADDFKTDTGTASFTITAVNDAPVNVVPGAQTVTADTNLSITGLSVSDLDAGSASITTTLSVAHGTLTVLTAGGAAVAGSGTGSVTLTGTQAQINTTLAAANNVVYTGVLNFSGSDTLTVVTDDAGNTGTPGALSDTDTVAITVTPLINPINGTAGNNTITGTSGADLIDAGKGSDIVNAGGGNDIIVAHAGDGNDRYNGGLGSDTLDLSAITAPVEVRLGIPVSGSTGRASGTQIGVDKLSSIENVIGGSGGDTILGNNAANTLDGGFGNDRLSGFGGTDTLIGGAGNDRLTGGAGTDTFVFHAGFDKDVVTDFRATGATHDILQFETSVFADFAAVMAASQQVGKNVVITVDPTNTITLQNTLLAVIQAHPEDFTFV